MLANLSQQKLSSLMGIVQRINVSDDLQETLSLIMSEAKQIMKSEASSLMLIDEETNELYFNVATGSSKDVLKEIRVPPGKGIAGFVAATGECVLINDAEHDPRIYRSVDEKTKFVTRNMICVPLILKGKTLGVLQVLNKIGNRGFVDDDLQLLRSLADFAALAINTRELYRKMQARAYEAYALYRLSESINFCDSVDDLLLQNIKIVSEVMEAKRVTILLRVGNKFRYRAGVGVPNDLKVYDLVANSPVLDFILRTGSGIFSADAEGDGRFPRESTSGYLNKSFVAAPLKLRNEIIAFLCITERARKVPYSYEDLRLVEMLAQQIMENYNHFKLSEEYKKKQIMEAELSITARIQQDILPREFPSDSKMDIAARTVPAKLVGGDFYDYLSFGNGHFGILISDVSGKGMPAGLFMAVSRSILRSHFDVEKDPEKILMLANRRICQDSKTCMFVTSFCCTIDTSRKEITFASAGHLNQYVWRRKSSRIEALHAPGKPLGVVTASNYVNRKTKYGRGDVLLLFTDGVTDALDENQEPYGEDRLLAMLSETAWQDSGNIADRIMVDVNLHQGEMEQFDDITLMAVKFL